MPALTLDGRHALNLRDYQEECLEAIARHEAEGVRRQLIVIPTGGGKTIVFATLAQRRGQRTLVIAHRDELINQAVDKVRLVWPDADIGVVKAERNETWVQDVVVASIQSLSPKRVARLGRFGLVVVDEAHHCGATTYKRMLDMLGCGPNEQWADGPLLLGVTATPDRGDGLGLNECFDKITFAKDILWMIRAGYLCDVRAVEIQVENLDLGKVAVRQGDYAEGALGAALTAVNAPRHIVKAWREHASDRQTAVFLPTIDNAVEVAAEFQAAGIAAASVSGVPLKERRDHLRAYEAGRLQVLSNAAVLCLDEGTEILTDRGWVGPDEMTYSHKVANWDQSSVFFTEPREIVVRDRGPNEPMFFLETRQRSIRVTGGHRMLYRTLIDGGWHKAPVEDLVGRTLELPTTGWAEPFDVGPAAVPVMTDARRRRLIASCSYNLRTREGYDEEGSKIEAARRVDRRSALRHTHPSKLTIAQCHLIGFWIGDGSVGHLRRGGVEYTLVQSKAYPRIIDWIDRTIADAGVHCVRRDHGDRRIPTVNWSLPRGTGGGSQEREGVYPIEPYLDKNGSPWLWGLDEFQFEAFLYGFWYADGDHGKAESGPPKTLFIHNSNRKLLDLLQSIASVRGWTASVYKGGRPAKPTHAQMWVLSLTGQSSHHIGGKKPDLRIQQEAMPWQPERVWCVKTETRNIITRRRGTVTVMGNTEGWDSPPTSCIVMARPTKSRALFAQVIGRGLRLYPGKDDCLVLDLHGDTERLDLCSVPSLFGVDKRRMRTRTAAEAVADKEAEEAKQAEQVRLMSERPTVPDARLVARDVELFKRVREQGHIAWARTRTGFAVSAGATSVVIDANGDDLYSVIVLDAKGSTETLMERVPLALATGIAEDHVRRKVPAAMVSKEAAWRGRMPSPRQREAAERLRISVDPSWSAGQVSDAITGRLADLRRRRAAPR